MDEHLDLLDWRRRIFEVYAAVRSSDAAVGWQSWRRERDELFRHHPASPLPPDRREAFRGLAYFDYDPALRLVVPVEPATPERFEVGASDGGAYAFSRIGRVRLELEGTAVSLDLFWLEAYGGGLFVPFADATSGGDTYGGGRYLLDTVKGADLGSSREGLVLDFNFAYQPSCSYDPRWSCPLAPPGNRLPVPVRAGERMTSY